MGIVLEAGLASISETDLHQGHLLHTTLFLLNQEEDGGAVAGVSSFLGSILRHSASSAKREEIELRVNRKKICYSNRTFLT